MADFGIAHIESSELTQVGEVIGTPSYMPPEQILGLPVDRAWDLFSVGVILYQLLTGERPFSGTAATTMRKVLKEEPLSPSRFNKQIPCAMDAVVRRALAKSADERFQSAEELRTRRCRRRRGARPAARRRPTTHGAPPRQLSAGTCADHVGNLPRP